jgi:hypothetical protein
LSSSISRNVFGRVMPSAKMPSGVVARTVPTFSDSVCSKLMPEESRPGIDGPLMSTLSCRSW